MATNIKRVVAAFLNRPWAIEPAKLEEIRGLLARRMEGPSKLTAAEVAAIRDNRARPMSASSGSVAVIPVYGVLAQRLEMMDEISGGTSTEKLLSAFTAAENDAAVSDIVLDVNSPGGAVDAGLITLANAIANCKKNVIAVANSQMCSAAYWLASGANEIVGAPMSQVGSIGVFTTHTDISGAQEQDGIKTTLISAGKYKVEGNPFEPLSDTARTHMQEMADEAYSAFVGAVAANRGVSVDAVKNGYGEGRALLASLAIKEGMIDRIATMDEVLSGLGANANAPRRRMAATGGLKLAAGPMMPEMPMPDMPDDEEPEIEGAEDMCPECGAPLDENGNCTECDYVSPDAGSDAAAAVLPSKQTQPASEARSATMPEGTVAPQGPDIKAIRAAESKRQNELRALAAEQKQYVTAEMLNEWLTSDVTYEAASAQVIRKQTESRSTAQTVAVNVGAPRADKDPRRGFANHTDFLMAAIDNAGLRDRADVSDERLRPLALYDKDDKASAGELAFMLPRAFTPTSLRATVGSDEQGVYADPYGGFAVSPQQSGSFLSIAFEGDPSAGLTQSIPMGAPSVEILARTDKDHSTSVSGGFTVARRAETTAFTASRAAVEKITLKASSLVGLGYESEELLTDSPVSFVALMASGFNDQFAAKILDEKIRGTGGNEFMGVKNAACKVSVAKETGQAADTIVFANILKMAARCYGFGQAVWMANHDCRPQLAQLSLPIGTGGVAVYQPSSQAGFPDMLWGRPVFYTEFCDTVGDQGDLILVNWSQYLEGTYQPLQSAESIHVRFVNHERTFKFWMRNAGAPWWRAPLTPNKSAATLSPIVLLDARA